MSPSLRWRWTATCAAMAASTSFVSAQDEPTLDDKPAIVEPQPPEEVASDQDQVGSPLAKPVHLVLNTTDAAWVRDDVAPPQLEDPEWWAQLYGEPDPAEAPLLHLSPTFDQPQPEAPDLPESDTSADRLSAAFTRTEPRQVALNASPLPDTGLDDDRSLSALASQELVRWDVGRSAYISGLGQRRRPDQDTLAFVLSAEAGFDLTPRAGLSIGYEVFRATDSGERSFSDTLDEGLFAQFRLRF